MSGTVVRASLLPLLSSTLPPPSFSQLPAWVSQGLQGLLVPSLVSLRLSSPPRSLPLLPVRPLEACLLCWPRLLQQLSCTVQSPCTAAGVTKPWGGLLSSAAHAGLTQGSWCLVSGARKHLRSRILAAPYGRCLWLPVVFSPVTVEALPCEEGVDQSWQSTAALLALVVSTTALVECLCIPCSACLAYPASHPLSFSLSFSPVPL